MDWNLKYFGYRGLFSLGRLRLHRSPYFFDGQIWCKSDFSSIARHFYGQETTDICMAKFSHDRATE